MTIETETHVELTFSIKNLSEYQTREMIDVLSHYSNGCLHEVLNKLNADYHKALDMKQALV